MGLHLCLRQGLQPLLHGYCPGKYLHFYHDDDIDDNEDDDDDFNYNARLGTWSSSISSLLSSSPASVTWAEVRVTIIIVTITIDVDGETYQSVTTS